MSNPQKCPHCGGNYGFYRNLRISGPGCWYYEWNGLDEDNTHLHDGLSYKEGKTSYCSQCHKKVKAETRTEELVREQAREH